MQHRSWSLNLIAGSFALLALACGESDDGGKGGGPAGTLSGSWRALGEVDTGSEHSQYVSLTVADGVPYLSFENTSKLGRAGIVSYADTAWSFVGDPGDGGQNANNIRTRVHGDHAYQIHRSAHGVSGASGQSLKLRKLDLEDAEASWTTIIDHLWTSPGGLDAQIEIDAEGRLYLAATLSSRKNSNLDLYEIRRSSDGGFTWETLGDASSLGVELKAGGPLAVSTEGTVYAAVERIEGDSSVATLLRYDESGWEKLGDLPAQGAGVTMIAWRVSVDPSGAPVVVVAREAEGAEDEIRAYGFASGQFKLLGGGPAFSGLLNPHREAIDISFSGDMPYVVYSHGPGADQLMVSGLHKGRWRDTSSEPLYTAITDYALADFDGAPLLVYSSNGKITALRFNRD